MGLISNGTTIFDAGALDSGLAKGAMTFIKKLTASVLLLYLLFMVASE